MQGWKPSLLASKLDSGDLPKKKTRYEIKRGFPYIKSPCTKNMSVLPFILILHKIQVWSGSEKGLIGFPKKDGGMRYEKEAATQKQDLFFSASSPLFRWMLVFSLRPGCNFNDKDGGLRFVALQQEEPGDAEYYLLSQLRKYCRNSRGNTGCSARQILSPLIVISRIKVRHCASH